MMEEVIALGPLAKDPRQATNHVHVTSERVVLHDHPPDAERSGGIEIPIGLFRQIWSLVYWKKPGIIEAKDEGGNLRRAEVGIGAVTLDHGGGKEIISTNAVWEVVAIIQKWEDAARRARMESHNALPPEKTLRDLESEDEEIDEAA